MMADEVLQQGVRGITDLMVMPGLINLDFADVRSVMGEMGKAMMGTGEAGGDNRAIEAAEQAIANPLLDGVSMRGARGVIISITGGEDMRLMEVDEAANHIKDLVDPDANIIWGSAFNNDLEGKIRVSVVATGIDADANVQPAPAKVFAFPARTAEQPKAAAPQAPEPAPAEEPQAADDPVAQEAGPEAAEASVAEELALDTPADDGSGEDELLLGDVNMIGEDDQASFVEPVEEEPTTSTGTRPWLQENAAPARPARQGGTLFERMSNIARGAAKARVDEDMPESSERDPLEIPRFLNRQNNQ
jgi:cell division protein FtsZ